VDGFNHLPLSIICHPDKKPSKETSELNDTIDQMDLKVIYRIFQPNSYRIYILLSSPLNFFQNSILRHKIALNKYKKIEISFILSDYNGINLEINI
jgi:hypothetical protein